MLNVKAFTFNPIQENTYLLYNGLNEALIIDPGCYFPEEEDEIKAFITQKGLTLKLLLNTHCHLDHVFGNRFIAETYGLPLHLHRLEQPLLDYAPASGLMYNLPFDNYQGEFVYLEPGKNIKLGDDELEVLFTPGHSPGSVSFYSRGGGFVIGGDVLFQNSIGRTDLPGGNHETLLGSIRTQLFTLPEETIVYSGHGPATTVGKEKRTNPFFN